MSGATDSNFSAWGSADRALLSEGLSGALVLRRQEEEGFNELPISRPRRLIHFAAEVLREPMVFLLIGCGLIYLVLGDRQEAIMLLGFLFIIVGITIYQERKAEHALDALRNLSSPRALVLRNGERRRIPGREVVRGDIAFVNEGDRVPADGKLLSGSFVSTDESLLSGESVPVDKNADDSLYAGTTVVRGQGVIRVTAIGPRTELGKIGKSIQVAAKEPTRLESQTRALVWRLSWVAAFLCVLVVIVYGFTRHDWLAGFLAGLSLAMAILPNELPAVLTIFLALGAWRMSQRRVLTRKMPAMENLGAATVLCVDKTGTLTLNKMSVQELYASDSFFSLSSLGHGPIPEEFHEVLEFGILASRQDPFDPMEKAFLEAGKLFLGGTEHLHPDWSLKREYPLSSELLSISHAWKSAKYEGHVVGAKGAPEAIIDLCHLNPAATERIAKKVTEMAEKGFRVIGVAKAKLKSAALPEKQHDFDFEFVGLVGLADPIRPGVPQAIAECRSAGIRVVMITGDHPNTARSIGRQIGLAHAENVLTGSELARISDPELQEVARNVSIFSRMTPDLKLRLVTALKNDGEIVAMTGDGVNDAPALKTADIGIAMGGRGTDVAREAAAIVLLDDDFSSIVEAIRMGRRVYANLQSAFIYLLSAHVPIAGISVLPVLLKLPLVLLPVHIAFLHLIIEPACSIAYEAEPARPATMRVPPRGKEESLYNRKMFLPSLARGGSVLAALLLIYVISLYRGQGELDARALTFTTLIISNLTLIVMIQKETGEQKRPVALNQVTLTIIAAAVVLLAIVLYVPPLRNLFRFSTLHAEDLGICIGVGILSAAWVELIRRPRS
ncbi:MAG: cation-translocating P-type ATPase [Oligoflexia bacterium]|nr:cation-translocating P-type ATPase [Oligoflexia bacterium]